MPTQSASASLANTVVSGVTETAAVTSPAITEALPHAGGLLVQGFVNLTPGTGMTTAQLTVRQGSGITGLVVVQQQPVTVVAGAPIDMPFYGIDGAPVSGSNQYTVTVTQAGGAGNGTLNQALITVDEIQAA